MKTSLIANRPVANLFRLPSLEVEVVSQVIYGTIVEVLAAAGTWLRLRTVDQYEGWALAEGFLPFVHTPSTRWVRVAQLSANVYQEPDVKKQAPLMQLPWESRLESRHELQAHADEPADWLPVRLLDGREAFVLRSDVSQADAVLKLEEMLTLALRFLGITYTWGGTSSFGFDCSGFVQMLFRQLGVTLPRDAQSQFAWPGFLAVERDALLPGDVLFFGANTSEINHVGLYLGDDRFIHDTTQGHTGIQISSLSEVHWAGLLAAQRRWLS